MRIITTYPSVEALLADSQMLVDASMHRVVAIAREASELQEQTDIDLENADRTLAEVLAGLEVRDA